MKDRFNQELLVGDKIAYRTGGYCKTVAVGIITGLTTKKGYGRINGKWTYGDIEAIAVDATHEIDLPIIKVKLAYPEYIIKVS